MPDPKENTGVDSAAAQRLHEAVSSKFDVGDYNTFLTKMDTPEKRQSFYSATSSKFDIGNYDDFEFRLKPQSAPPAVNVDDMQTAQRLGVTKTKDPSMPSFIPPAEVVNPYRNLSYYVNPTEKQPRAEAWKQKATPSQPSPTRGGQQPAEKGGQPTSALATGMSTADVLDQIKIPENTLKDAIDPNAGKALDIPAGGMPELAVTGEAIKIGKSEQLKYNQLYDNSKKLYDKSVQTQVYLKHLALNGKADEYSQTLEQYKGNFGGETPEEHVEKLKELKDSYLYRVVEANEGLADLIPDLKQKSYGEGAAKSFAGGMAGIYDSMDGASKFLSDYTGLEHKGFFKDVANFVREKADENLADMPDDMTGHIVGGIAGTVPLLLELAATPNKLGTAVKLGRGIQVGTKLPTILALNNAGASYSQTGDAGEALKSGAEGLAQGFALEFLGYGSNKIAKVAKDIGAGNALSRTAGATAAGLGSGTEQMVRNYIHTGEWDAKQFAEGFGVGIAFEYPRFLRQAGDQAYQQAQDNFFTASPEAIRDVNAVEKSVTELRDEAIKNFADAAAETAPEKKSEKLIISDALNKMADIKGMTENILKNPNAYIDHLQQRTDIPEAKRKELVDHINTVVGENDRKMQYAKTVSDVIQQKKREIDINKQNPNLGEEVKLAMNAPLEKEIADMSKQAEEIMKPPVYKIGEQEVSAQEFVSNLNKPEFIEQVKNDKINIGVERDDNMVDLLVEKFQQPVGSPQSAVGKEQPADLTSLKSEFSTDIQKLKAKKPAPPRPETVPLPEAAKTSEDVFTTDNQKYKIEKTPEGLRVLHADTGAEPSAATQLKITKQYEQAYDYAKGETALQKAEKENAEFTTPEESEQYIAKHSDNPLELIEAYQRTMEFKDEKSYKDQILDEMPFAVKPKSFADFDDVNNVGMTMAKRFFNKDGWSVDQVAEHASEMAGIEITPTDVVEFMKNDTYQRQVSPLTRDIMARFKEVTGMNLNERVVQAAAEREFTATASEKEFLNKQYETAEQAERDYYEAIKRGEIPELKPEEAGLVAGEEAVRYGEKGVGLQQNFYTPRPGLPEAYRQVEEKFGKEIASDMDGMKKKYFELPETRGNIINTDYVRSLSPDYLKNKNLVQATQNPASSFAERIYMEEVKKPAPADKADHVIWTAGGSGSGKSTSLQKGFAANRAHLVVDGNLSDVRAAITQINAALANGKTAHIKYTYRDPVKAFMNGVIPRYIEPGHEGRPVPVDIAVGTSERAMNVVRELAEYYKGNKSVNFEYFNNSFAQGKAKKISENDARNLKFNRILVENKIQDNLKQKLEANEITKEQYESLSGKKADGLQPGGIQEATPRETERAVREGYAGSAEQRGQSILATELLEFGEGRAGSAKQREQSILSTESLEFNEKKSTYQTQGGEEIPHTSFREQGIIDFPSGDDLSGKKSEAQNYGPGLKPGEICWMERQLSEKKGISLTGPTKIKSPSDVAYLFRHLENASTENMFAVLKKKNGSYNVLYLSTGATTGTTVDPKLIYTAAKEFKADSVVLVHNHPSGSLQASEADYAILSKMKETFGEAGMKMEDGIIINLDSGKYAEFANKETAIKDRPGKVDKEKAVKVFEFDKQKLYTPSAEKFQIKRSEDVAVFLSQQKRGTVPKLGILVLDTKNSINRYVMEDGLLSDKALADKILNNVGKSGENVILVSNDRMDPIKIRSLNEKLNKALVRILDVVETTDNTDIVRNHKSWADEGMMEPKEKYGKVAEASEKYGKESEYDKELVKLAARAKTKGVRTAEEFAELMGEKVEDVQKAWEAASRQPAVGSWQEQPKLFEIPETPQEAAKKAEAFTKKQTPEAELRGFVKSVKDGASTEGLKEAVDDMKLFYKTMSNKEVLERVDKEIAEDLGAVKEDVLSDSPPSADKSAKAIRLIKHYESKKDYSAAIELIEQYDTQLREAGRFIQAASLWNKLAPETIVRSAKKISKELGRELSKEDQEFVLKRMTEIVNMEEGAAKDMATLDVLNFVAEKIPHTKKELFDAFRYQNMLSNPRTHLRNIYSNMFNTFVTRPLDLMGMATYDLIRHPFNPAARDAKMADIPKYYQEVLTMIPNAMLSAKEAYKNGFVADKILDLKKTSNMIEEMRKTKLPKALTVSMRMMEAQDRFFSLLIGQGEKGRLMKNGIDEAEATVQGKALAEKYLFREKVGVGKDNQNLFSQALDSIGTMVMQARKLPVIGEPFSWFVPFVTTPINVAKSGIAHSPLGFMPGIKTVGGKLKFQELSKESIASATFGTVLTGVGAVLAMQGRTSWAPPKDKKEKALFYASGRKPYSILMGDKWVPMTYFGPFAVAMALPAAVKHFQEDTGKSMTDSELSLIGDAALSMTKYLSSQTPVAGVGGFFKMMDGEDDYSIGKIAGFATTQAIPLSGLVRYINSIYDPIFRKSKGYVETIEKDLPELSKTLEAHETPEGEPAQREDINFFMPYDLGMTDKEYELQLQARRDLVKTLAPQKEEAKKRKEEAE